MNNTYSFNLRYFAILREQAGITNETVETNASTPGDLYKELVSRYNFTLPAESIKAAVNDQFENMDTTLKDGDSIVFIPPVAGG
tara:strand:+ start:477 stop:728 length:252 start_codon:yes stop_codon:yes gene_type:complete